VRDKSAKIGGFGTFGALRVSGTDIYLNHDIIDRCGESNRSRLARLLGGDESAIGGLSCGSRRQRAGARGGDQGFEVGPEVGR
jgi:hypothetical protein